jgi:drug/metabolite transporter (DMT)-like permease
MRISRDPNPRAGAVPRSIAWMLLTTFLFVCVHATGKYLVASYPVGQVVWGRYFFHLLFVVAVLGPRLGRAVRTANLPLQLLRSGFMLGATVFYFAGVRLLPLTEANAIAFTTPILVALLARPVLGERVGPRRWLGVAFGFLGALIVVRPGSGVMELAAGILIASSFCNAFYQITTRQLGARDDSLTTLFYTATVGTVAASLALLAGWAPMDMTGWLLMAAIGAFACGGHFALIKAYQGAPASVVAPFNYANLVWAVFFGFFVFGDLPDTWTVLGAVIIVASGLYILHREKASGRPGGKGTF